MPDELKIISDLANLHPLMGVFGAIALAFILWMKNKEIKQQKNDENIRDPEVANKARDVGKASKRIRKKIEEFIKGKK